MISRKDYLDLPTNVTLRDIQPWDTFELEILLGTKKLTKAQRHALKRLLSAHYSAE